MKATLQKLWLQFLGLFPTALPTGVTSFNAWADSFSETYEMPTQDKTSIRYTLATIIMHLGEQAAFRSKFFFFLTVKAAAAKQVAGQVFYDIKVKQKEAEAAAKAAAEVSNEPQV